MNAVFLERHGSPEVLIERQMAPLSTAPNQVKIEVMAAGVNFADLLQRVGLYGSAPKLPYIPGFEVAGVVKEVGPAVKDFSVGERVIGMSKCGGYAPEICVSKDSVRPLPDHLSYAEGATLPVNYLTAWFCLFTMGNLQAGERVLIHGGAGGVGIAAIQLAREHTVQIWATVGSERKRQFVIGLGVDHAINYKTTDFVQHVLQHTNREGADLILDPVGGKTLRKSYQVLAPLGRVVSYGLSAAAPKKHRDWLKVLKAWWNTPRFSPLQMIGRNVGVFGFHLALLGSKNRLAGAAFDSILQKAENGMVAPVVSAVFPLSAKGAIQAHHYLHERRNIGKVLLVRENA